MKSDISTIPPPDDILRHLRVFLSVASTGSISRAAEQIFKAASAITRTLLRLEQALGTELFERRPRGMLLNRYGEAVYQRALRIHDEIHTAACELGQHRTKADAASLTQLLMSGNKLRIFVCLADCGQLSAVASQLNLGKSGISMALTRLEDAIGQPLFQRMAQGMVTTDAAARLLLHAKRALAEVRHMQADVSALQGSLRGTLTIGALPLCRTRLLPAAIARLLQQYPQLKVKTYESPFAELAKGLRCGDIDFILGALRQQHDGFALHCEPLFQDQVSVFCRAGHPLTRAGADLSLAALGQQKWLLPRQDSPARQALEAAFLRCGQPCPEPSVESGDLAIVRSMLASTDLITATSSHQLHDEIVAGHIVPLPVTLGDTRRQIGITQRHDSAPSPALHALLQAIRDVAAQPPF